MVVKRLYRSAIAIFVLCLLASCAEPPAIDNTIDLNELTIKQIHQAYKQQKYNSEALVNAYIDRIKQLDSKTNAITVINPDAVSIAQKFDEEFKRTGKLRPLHGIPIIVKDNFNTKGLPTTAGALALKDFVADNDAFILEKLIEAGGIVLAKSNMAEWAFSAMHTESSTAGTTRNPYNLAHVPAGSSGGTAVAIAANMGVIGLGTDTGNSIRGPSSHNALVGFRPTLGLTSRSGIVPLYLRNDTAGPMMRTVEDAARVLDVIAGYDPKDPLTAYSKGKVDDNYLQYLVKNGLEGARIGVLRQLSDNDVDPQVSQLFSKAIDDLSRLGATVIDTVHVKDFDELRTDQWCASFRADVEAYLDEFVKDESLTTLEDIIRIGTSSEYAEESLNYFVDNSGRASNPDIACENAYTDVRRVAFRDAIEDEMERLNLDALIYPTWNHKPALVDAFEEGYKGDSNQIISPHTGQPAFTVPMGYTYGNLPAGLQFLGRMYSEPVLIKLSYAYEQGTKHRVPPNLE
ncbi:amidase [Alteromonadaceae bacterium M269]|nr:amidase [Alteromonadaceae bacterium M269]